MKKQLLITISCILGLGLISCSTSNVVQSDSEQQLIGGGVQLANPFYDCETLKEAADIAGFSMKLPDATDLPVWAAENIGNTIYRATKTNLLEIIFPEDPDLTREVRIRKAISDREDMSGDYNSYEKECDMKLDGKTVKARINGELIWVVTWKDGEYSYSARVTGGLDEKSFAKLISKIK